MFGGDVDETAFGGAGGKGGGEEEEGGEEGCGAHREGGLVDLMGRD